MIRTQIKTNGFSTIKRSLLLCGILLIGINFRGYSQAATPCTTAVNLSNFGVDADLFANSPLFVNGDDWFASNPPGANIGLIGLTAATAKAPLNISAAAFKALIQAGKTPDARNLTYEQHMSVPSGTVQSSMLLWDAVAARDNHSATGSRDSSVFSSSSEADKNADNPYTWSIGIGNVPHKNDLIDVGGHIRQDLINGHLMGYCFATTLATDGNSHTDFEFFHEMPVFDINSGKVSNTGPLSTGGHTTQLFFNNGVTKQSGDILLSVDYFNGGKSSFATVRIWIDPNNVDGNGNDTAYINKQASRPFTFTGVFNTGKGANGFGYAEIRPNTGNIADCFIWKVTNSSVVNATPWGSLVGPQAVYSDWLIPMQLVEVAIDFTAFGVGINVGGGVSGVCSVSFANLLIKTRTSQSFTSELKDYAGPYEFQIR